MKTCSGRYWDDVDFSLRLQERGYRVVFTPYALPHHLES
jgi:GT2 family glycosyltransferase